MKTIEIISIGNELLAGITVNTNASWISMQLAGIGLTTARITTIADTHNEIFAALKTASANADVIICTGGLGPTVDDITKNTICEYFNTRLVLHPETLQRVQELFRRRNIKMAGANKAQAMVPESCTVLPNQFGTAPGMLFEQDKKLFFFLPGVPKEMKGLINNSILEILQNRFKLPPVRSSLMRTTGIAESSLFELLAPALEKHPKVGISFLPKYSGVDIRLKSAGNKSTDIDSFEQLHRQIRQLAAKFIFSEEEIALEEAVQRIMIQQKFSLAVAESFTGGMIEDRITNISGSSGYFLGGIVTYSNKSKMNLLDVNENTLQKFGAVSQETVREMVRGVQKLFGSNCAIATTGIAGPGGGTETKPVGLCFIAARLGDREVIRKFTFGTDRQINKIRGATAGLELLRRMLLDLGE